MFPPSDCAIGQEMALSVTRTGQQTYSSIACKTGQQLLRLAIPNCASNQLVVFDGSNFFCQSPSAIPACTVDQFLSFNGSSYQCKSSDPPPACSPTQVLTYGNGDYTCVERNDGVPVCTAEQFLTYNGITFQCATTQNMAIPTCSDTQALTGVGGALACRDLANSSLGSPLYVKTAYYTDAATINGILTQVLQKSGYIKDGVWSANAHAYYDPCHVDQSHGGANSAAAVSQKFNCVSQYCSVVVGKWPAISQGSGCDAPYSGESRDPNCPPSSLGLSLSCMYTP